MYVTNDSTCNSQGQWTPVSAQQSWTLASKNKLVAVYIRYRNSNKVSACLHAQIVHDDIAPVIDIIQSPPATSQNPTETIKYAIIENGSGIKEQTCGLDQQAQVACTSPVVTPQLNSGSHSITIGATDLAGNPAVPKSVNWNTLLGLPSVKILSGPKEFTNQTTANFSISGEIAGKPLTQFLCAIDSETQYVQCNDHPSYLGVNEGTHTFRVKSVDSAGRKSEPASYTWTVDLTPPTITLIEFPPAKMSRISPAVVEYAVQDSLSGPVDATKCGFDSALKSCPLRSEQTLASQTEGQHQFNIIATDRAGNQAQKTTSWYAENIIQYPSLDNIASVAYEDLFPKAGDADYNDFITNFKITEVVNAAGQVSKIVIDFVPRATGAGYDHRLLLSLDGIKDQPSNITSKTAALFNGSANISLIHYDKGGRIVSEKKNLPKDKDVEIFSSTHAVFNVTKGSINVRPDVAQVQPVVTARVAIELKNPELNAVGSRKEVDLSRFRLILAVKNTNKDIDLINVSKQIDANGFPFGFVIPTNWKWPAEKVHIDTVYPYFPQYRKYLLQTLTNPNATAPAHVRKWYKYPAANAKTGIK